MPMPLLTRFVCVGVLSMVAAGCAVDLQPYIYNPSEFDRTSKNFNQPVEDRGKFMICYNKHKATPKKIRDMAVLECAKFNKTAEYVKQEVRLCPLATPVSVYYNCVGEDSEDKAAK